jgi:hypothetical protein
MRLAPIALVFLIAALPAAAAPGGLDPTFSGNGWVRTYEVSGARPYFPKGAEEVAIQPDGKILAVSELQDANSHWWFGVWRWLPNGELQRERLDRLELRLVRRGARRLPGLAVRM